MTSSESYSPTRMFDGRGVIRWLFPVLLVLVTFIAYIPAWHGGFLWKDDQFILHNPYINFWQGLYRIWFKTSVQYYPLTYTTFWIEYHFWGMNPLGYHLVNIGLHALDAILLWVVLLRLNVPGAWLASAIFALHPVNVESVAWIVERKNTLSTAFYLCSILAALKFWLPDLIKSKPPQTPESLMKSETPPNAFGVPDVGSYAPLTDWKFYWLSFGLFICALFCKTTTIPLPAVLLLLVWWKRGRIAWRDIYPCIPFVAAGMAIGLITHHVEHSLGAAGKEFQFSFVDRVLLAARNFWFYLGKIAWPHPLMFVYPRWNIRPSSPLAWLPLLAFVPLLIVLWVARKTWGRTVFVALAYFGGMLFLMLGFFNIFFFLYSFVSDHFVYLACMGPIALFAAGITRVMCRSRGNENLIKSATLQTSRSQTRSETPDVVSYGEKGGRRRGNETLIKSESPQMSESPVKSETPHVVSYGYGYGYGYVAVCACLLAILAALTWRQSHAYAGEVTLWRDTIAKNPRAFLAYNNLGSLLYNNGQLDAAIADYEKSVAIHPDAEIFHNLGNTLLQRGKAAEAYGYFQKALKLDPGSATVYLDLGTYYLNVGRADLAIQNLQKAVKLQPDLAMAYYNLGNAYIQNRQLDAAILYWQKAVDLQPGFAVAHNNLGNAYQLKGQIGLAIENWRDAWIAQPNMVSAEVNLAWVWATCPDASLRDGADALTLAQEADQLTGGANPMVLRVVAAAFAENGQYPDAVAAAQQALQALQKGGRNRAFAAAIQQQLKLYENSQPYRDPGLKPVK